MKSNDIKSSDIDMKSLRHMLVSFSPRKKSSEFAKLSMFKDLRSEAGETPKPIRITRRHRQSPVYWNIDDSEIKPIKSRSRLEDFTFDSVSQLFPKKSPSFEKTKSARFPPIRREERFFNKKLDKIVQYRESILRLKRQGFLITRT